MRENCGGQARVSNRRRERINKRNYTGMLYMMLRSKRTREKEKQVTPKEK